MVSWVTGFFQAQPEQEATVLIAGDCHSLKPLIVGNVFISGFWKVGINTARLVALALPPSPEAELMQ